MRHVAILVLLTGCTAPANPVLHSEMICADPAGFWLGLWHGMIVPITGIVSLFTDDVSIYAVCNTGGGYDFGFWLGVGGLAGSGSASARARR